MLERYFGDDQRNSMDWENLAKGGPTIIGFARLCSDAMGAVESPLPPLSVEAQTILFLCRERGIFEIRGTNDAFDSCDRILTIHVETSPEQSRAIKPTGNVRQAIRFLDGLREICRHGLVMHQLQREFTLTTRGFETADTIVEDAVSELLAHVQAPE